MRTGAIRLPSLTPGGYDVSFALPGFQHRRRDSASSVSGGMETVLNAATAGRRAQRERHRGWRVRCIAGRRAPAASARHALGRVVRRRCVVAAPGRRRRAAVGRVSTRPVTSTRRACAQQIDAAAAQLGDLFEYKLKEPVTIRKNQSALVPILSGDVAGRQGLALERGVRHQPRRCARSGSPTRTGLTLDGGSFSVDRRAGVRGRRADRAAQGRRAPAAVVRGRSRRARGREGRAVPTRVDEGADRARPA